MIDSEVRPKIKELRVIEKELRSMLRHIHSLHSFRTLIFCKNNLNSELLFCKSILLNVNVMGLSNFVNVYGLTQNEMLPRN